ncbi:MAG: DEAD/DEAH box helicase family protein [Trichodesmium sp.]
MLIEKIANHYRSGKFDLAQDFFIPCLKNCIQYRRAVGYFSSGALVSWAEAIPYLLDNNAVIKLIISPELSEEDKTTLAAAINQKENYQFRQIIADKIIKDALKLSIESDSIHLRQKLLAWMIANEKLILKFAFPQHINQVGIFHEKIGIFDLENDNFVAFTGSANESRSGYSRNYESIDVYRSWVSADVERVKIKIEEFEETWSGKAVGLKIISLSSETIDFIRSYAPNKKPDIKQDKRQNLDIKTKTLPLKIIDKKNSSYQWQHQEEAVEKFLIVGHGVLEMATGTGKTRTTLKILSKLDELEQINGIIISTEGTDLLDQWSKEIHSWSVQRPKLFRVFRHYSSYHELESFALNPERAVLIVSREKLGLLFNRLESKIKSKLIIVHDEVHGLGSLAIRQQLTGKHEDFGYRLGLSATPEREYDSEGTEFIFAELGEVFFQFGVKEAIERGILCEFDYIPLVYELTNNDKERLQQVYRQKEARLKAGKPMREEEVWIKLSRVYKTAENKPNIFADFLVENPQILQSTIIFVEEKEYGNQLLDNIHNYTHRYRTYYSGEEQKHLQDFAQGKIDCLITCHRVSQGIDIKNLENVILFSSARAKLETIQRIGRCLRINPNHLDKRAKVVDFVLESEDNRDRISADEERYEWLSELSKFRRKS